MHSGGVITGEGMQEEIHFVYTDVSVFASGMLKKAPQGACSSHSVAGTFALFGEATFSPTGIPLRSNHVGTITFDGAGKFLGHETVNIIGTPTFESDFTGTYTVNNDCTVTAELVSPTVGVVHEAGVITGTGIKQEVHTIVMESGWSFADTLKRQ
jgi:hypothetical protein